MNKIIIILSLCIPVLTINETKADMFYWESEYNTLAEKLMMTEENLIDLEEKYENDTKELEAKINELKKQIKDLNVKVETLQLVIKSKN